MKKNMKIASIVAAALLAVAPVAGTFANQHQLVLLLIVIEPVWLPHLLISLASVSF